MSAVSQSPSAPVAASDVPRMGKAPLWITWERQRRNRSLAREVGAQLWEMEFRGSRFARYCKLATRTARLIWRTKPDVVFFQNPSLVLAMLIVSLRSCLPGRRFVAVGDFHNSGVAPPVGSVLVPWLVRRCDLVIVSNDRLAADVEGYGGRCVSVPDPIPNLTTSGNTGCRGQENGDFEVFCICSWASDEPVFEILKAAQMLEASQPSVLVSITGRACLERIGWKEPLPKNVRLAGYLPDADFDERLVRASVVMDLTTRPNCMVCGAYEAVAAGTPMILSGNEATVRYFDQGAIFTDNSAESIASAIVESLRRRDSLREEVTALKSRITDLQSAAVERLLAAVSYLSLHPRR